MSTSKQSGSGTICAEEATKNIQVSIARLRADEIAAMGQQKRSAAISFISWIPWIGENVNNFILLVKFPSQTWAHVAKGVVNRRFDYDDAISLFYFASLTSFVMIIIFLWCLISSFPPFVLLYNLWSSKRREHTSLVNSANPGIFKALSKEQAFVAKQKLGNPAKNSNPYERVFDFDIAKFLLQLSSVVYEHSTANVQAAVSSASDNIKAEPKTDPYQINDPGALLGQLVHDSQIQPIFHLLDKDIKNDSDIINALASDHGLCWAPVSELATTSQAFCSVFWDPMDKWMIVVFKGTDPVSFDEWLIDFTAAFANASQDIARFKFVHRGFKERLFGADPGGLGGAPHEPTQKTARRPYDTIAAAINIVATELVKCHGGDDKINVWMTGHSLGTAVASLAYAKVLMSNDLCEHAVLRDAYLFATPIVCDRISRFSFNKAIRSDPDIPRNMFRITNREDFVATGLPALGDRTDIDLDRHNLFNFCHLGQEILMKTKPSLCEIQFDTLPPGVKIRVQSHYSPQEIVEMRKHESTAGWVINRVLVKLQDIPVVGRLVAHAPAMYWDQLEQIAVNENCSERS